MKINITLFAIFCFILTACSQQAHEVRVSQHNNQGDVVTPASITKRINTTQCKDSDDWYLDGYRVGKSFANQKMQMLKQRADYCQLNVQKLPSHFKANWDKGFAIGNGGNSKIPTQTKGKKSKN